MRSLLFAAFFCFGFSLHAADIYQRLYSSTQVEFDLLREADPSVLFQHLAEMRAVGGEDARRWLREAKGEAKFGPETPGELLNLQQIHQEILKLERDLDHPFSVRGRKINLVFIGGQLLNLWATWNHVAAVEFHSRYEGHWLKISRAFIQERPKEYERYFADYLRRVVEKTPGPVVLVDSSVYGFSLSFANRVAARVLGEENVRSLDFQEGYGTLARRQLNEQAYAKALEFFKKYSKTGVAPVKVKPYGLDGFLATARFDNGKYSQLGRDGEPEANMPLAGSQLQRDLLEMSFSEIVRKYVHRKSDGFSIPPEPGFLRSRVSSLLMLKALYKRLERHACESSARAL